MADSDESIYSNPRESCIHGACYLVRSFTYHNPGRRFWKCPLGDKPNGYGYFRWADVAFEGRAKTTLLDSIRRSHRLVENEENEAAEKIEELNDELEAKMTKYRVENKRLKQAVKETKRRLHKMYFVLIVMYFIFLVWIFNDNIEFVSSNKRLLA